MALYSNEFEINKDEPFKNDKLERRREIENLTSIFNALDNKMVLAINSRWGTGKTTFLKMWEQYLKNKNYKTIFFNAWENDFVQEPFIAFISEIKNTINDDKLTENLIEKGKELGKFIINRSPKIAFKLIKDTTGIDLSGYLNSDDIKSIIDNKFEEYEKVKVSVKSFKEELSILAKKQFADNNNPLVIFIDELDRCRPDFAIQLLERVKHLFNVENVIFVLGIDKEALSNSIKVVYGEQTNINGYLTRFIDLEYKLKDAQSVNYIDFLLDKYNFEQIFNERKKYNFEYDQAERDYTDFCEVIKECMINFNLSLRDFEKVLAQLYLILKIRYNKYIYTYLCIFLLILKKLDGTLYIRIKSNSCTYNEFMNHLDKNKNLEKWFEDISKRGYVFKAFIIWLLNDESEVEKISSKIRDDNYSDPNRALIDCYKHIVGEYRFLCKDRNNIFDEIDLYNNFTIQELN